MWLCGVSPCSVALCTALVACGRLDYDAHGANIVADAVGVSLGNSHLCVLRANGLACAGANDHGQLGLADPSDHPRLTPVVLPREGASVSAGYISTAVLDPSGIVWTFGDNGRGQLGRTSIAAIGSVTLPEPTVQLVQRFEHGCALSGSGALHCWGSNTEGELGQGDPFTSGDHSAPLAVAPSLAFIDVSPGQGHTCAVTDAGVLLCWGRNTEGELGLGEEAAMQIRTPTEVQGRLWRSVVCGQAHTCAIDEARDVYCWGADLDADGHAGPVGAPGVGFHHTPLRVAGGGDWRQLATDTFHTCGLREDDSLWCWGRNNEGQLGLGDNAMVVEAPTRIGVDNDWASVAVGRFTTCAIKHDGRLFCAGDNRRGALAAGDLVQVEDLRPVQLPD